LDYSAPEAAEGYKPYYAISIVYPDEVLGISRPGKKISSHTL
jgi:hypothetical protein